MPAEPIGGKPLPPTFPPPAQCGAGRGEEKLLLSGEFGLGSTVGMTCFSDRGGLFSDLKRTENPHYLTV